MKLVATLAGAVVALGMVTAVPALADPVATFRCGLPTDGASAETLVYFARLAHRGMPQSILPCRR